MHQRCQNQRLVVLCALLGIYGGSSGCVSQSKPDTCPNVPRELKVVSLPPYVIEPPDILLINAVRVVPKPPYHIEPMDTLNIQATNTLPPPAEPVAGVYQVDADGTVNLGLTYGKVQLAGLTLAEAEAAIRKQLALRAQNPQVSVAVNQTRASQMISGDHLVRMDGTVGMGIYGSVYVANMTLDQAKAAIEQQLGQSLKDPQVTVDIYSYNSKWYYLIFDWAGYGERVMRLPITGKETVLDAVSMMFGLQYVSSKRHIWVARPNGADPCHEQILPVDWIAIASGGNPATNYQLMPNDRIYVKSDALIHANIALSKLFGPIERIFGVTLLGTSVLTSIEGAILSGQSIERGGSSSSLLVPGR